MRRNWFLFAVLAVFALSLLLPGASLASSAAAAAQPLVDWAWLVKEVASGKKTIDLPNSITFEGEEGLFSEETVTINGKHFTLTGAVVDGGSFIFTDVYFDGGDGIDREDGGAALTLRGEGAIAVLMGDSRAVGGHSGENGNRGGDGILLEGDRQGLILRGAASAVGGIGLLEGGAGVRVTGQSGNVRMTDSASAIGDAGLARGGAGLDVPACCKVTLDASASVLGGRSVQTAGAGILSRLTDAGGQAAPVSVGGAAIATGGAGDTGGDGVSIARSEPGEASDLLLSGEAMLFGGNGGVAGSALKGVNCRIEYAGKALVLIAGGHYYEDESPVKALEGCVEAGDADKAVQEAGVKLTAYPANNLSQVIDSAVMQRGARYAPAILEDGLTKRNLVSKLGGLSVERGRVSRAGVNGGGLKITMFNGTYEQRLEFEQRFFKNGEDVCLALIASKSMESYVVESTVAALKKLVSLGAGQLAYTSVDPVYCERIIDLAAVLEAVDAQESPVETVQFGTADDSVIFLFEGGAKEYQEELMQKVLRPLARGEGEEKAAE